MKRNPAQHWHIQANLVLNEVWTQVLSLENIDVASKATANFKFAELISKGGSTYPYVLLGQVLAKATVPHLNALCLQESSELSGSYDVRMMVKNVVCPWNKSAGKPFDGISEDPYVNNPARYKNFGVEMESKAKNKAQYRNLLAVVNHIQEQGQQEARRLLFGVLIEARRAAELHRREFIGPIRASLDDVLSTLSTFLSVKSNGVRLQVVCYSLYKTLSAALPEMGEILTHAINTADTASKSVGDVECLKDGKVVLAIEVKDRALTDADLETAIHKARNKEVDNLLFFLYDNRENLIEPGLLNIARAEFKRGIDINFVDAISFVKISMSLLTPEQRAKLFLTVHDALHELGAQYKHVLHWNELMKTIG
jgi:SacI restriction endonuclease